MSGTRSPFLKAPATEAVLVSHGQPSHQAKGEAHLRALAREVQEFLPGWSVRSATLAAPGTLDHALSACRTAPMVFPVFMADGWFTQKALARRLEGSGARQLPPLGVHPELPRLTARLLRSTGEQAGWARSGFEVLLAAHGSATGPAAGECTMTFAATLARWLPTAQIRVGFLEQDPHLADVAAVCGLRTLALPFFAGVGGHLTRDVPEALDRAGFHGLRMQSLGEAYFVPELIAHTLRYAACEDVAA